MSRHVAPQPPLQDIQQLLRRDERAVALTGTLGNARPVLDRMWDDFMQPRVAASKMKRLPQPSL